MEEFDFTIGKMMSNALLLAGVRIGRKPFVRTVR